MKARDLLTPAELAAIDVAAGALRKLARATNCSAVTMEVRPDGRMLLRGLSGYESWGTRADLDPHSTDPMPSTVLGEVEVGDGH